MSQPPTDIWGAYAGRRELTSEGLLRLGNGQIDVWLTSLYGVNSDLQLAYLQLLSEPERARWKRFVAQDAQLQYLVSRALVRTTLSRYTEVPEHAWEFETNRYGRPHVSQPQAARGILFNLSNTTGLVACAVAKDCDIGIDVENIMRTLDIDALAPTVFAPVELADVRRTPPADRRERFFSYWTLKEAYIKGRGMGLSLPLDAFWFDLNGLSPTLNVTDRCPDRPERWRFHRCAPTPEHRMAIAVAAPRGTEPSIYLRWITPTSADAEPGRPSGNVRLG
jgi:4'-phosphopantetheinyl transferase